jgi:hypothetical protein
MSRPTRLAVTAGAAVLVVAVGQCLHLLTVAIDRPASQPRAAVLSNDTGGAVPAAVRFTQHLLACPRTPTHPTDRPCGALRDIDTAPQPIDSEHIVVLLTATLHSPTTAPATTRSLAAAVPVALRLLVTRTDGAWVVVGGAA